MEFREYHDPYNKISAYIGIFFSPFSNEIVKFENISKFSCLKILKSLGPYIFLQKRNIF